METTECPECKGDSNKIFEKKSNHGLELLRGFQCEECECIFTKEFVLNASITISRGNHEDKDVAFLCKSRAVSQRYETLMQEIEQKECELVINQKEMEQLKLELRNLQYHRHSAEEKESSEA